MKTANAKVLTADLTLALVTGIWGIGFIATEYAINANWGPGLIMAARFAVAALALSAVLRGKIRRITLDEWKFGGLAGIFLFAAFYMQTIGQGMTTVSNAAFLTATNVVMVPFISWKVNRDKPGVRTIVLTLTALAGVAVLSFKNGGFIFNPGDLFVLLSAALFALHITWLEKATLGRSAAAINFVQILTSAVISIVLLLTGGVRGAVAGADIRAGALPVLFLGLFSTCLCFFLQTNAQKYTSAAKVGVILSLEGFFGSLFSVLMRFEPLTASLVIGGVMIISASVLINLGSSIFQRLMPAKADPVLDPDLSE